MTKDFTLTLKVARRQSGLSQEDCAHLINTHRTKISRLERGETPNIVDMCKLAMIYGKPLESLCSEIFRDIRHELKTQVDSLPQYQEKRSDRFNRSTTITNIAQSADCLDYQITRKQNCKNKYQEAAKLVELYPVLEGWFPRKPFIWLEDTALHSTCTVALEMG